MIYNGKEIEFPAIMQFSFIKLIEDLEKKAKSDDKAIAEYAKSYLKVVDKYPALKDGISDPNEFDKYKEGIEKIGGLLFHDFVYF